MEDPTNKSGYMSLADVSRMLASYENVTPIGEAGDDAFDREQVMAEQKKMDEARLMARDLGDKLYLFTDNIKNAKTAGDLFNELNRFYGRDLPMFMDSYDITAETSDFIKVLIGLYYEFVNLIPVRKGSRNISLDGNESVAKLGNFIITLAAALGVVIFCGDWQKAEESVTEIVINVPEVIKVTGVEIDEMADINLDAEVVKPGDKVAIRKIREKLSSLRKKDGISQKLYRFARGETALEDMTREAEIWEEVKTRVEAVLFPTASKLN